MSAIDLSAIERTYFGAGPHSDTCREVTATLVTEVRRLRALLASIHACAMGHGKGCVQRSCPCCDNISALSEEP